MADWRDYTVVDGEGGSGKPPPWRDWIALLGLPVLGILGAIAIFTSYYTVDAGHVGVLTRFGAFIEEVSPGLHFKMPMGIDRVISVAVDRRQKMEFGFTTERAGQRTEYAPTSKNDLSVSSMLTGDQNIAVVQWVVQYQIRDAKAYLFRVRDPEDTLRDVGEAAMRRIVGDRSVNELFTTGRAEVAAEARVLLQRMLNRYNPGINVVTVELQDVSPPKPVEPAFNAVNQAQQERDQRRNEGMRAYQKAIPQAEGQAKKLLAAAEGYQIERINRAQGEVAEFVAVYEEYRKAPKVTRQRMYLEMAVDVFPRIKNKHVLDKQSGALPLLNLGGKVVAP